MGLEFEETWKPAPPAPRIEIQNGPDKRAPGEPNLPLLPRGYSMTFRTDLPASITEGRESPEKGRTEMLATVAEFKQAVGQNRKLKVMTSGRNVYLTEGNIGGNQMTDHLLGELESKGIIQGGRQVFAIDFDVLEDAA